MSKCKYDLIDRKFKANVIADKYFQLSKSRGRVLSRLYLNYSQNITNCAESVLYVQKVVTIPHYDGFGDLEYVDEQTRLRLVKSSFCRTRLCPICQWRRAVRSQAQALKIFPEMLRQLPGMRYLFLTLTVKNCPITRLADQVRHLNYSWYKFTKTCSFPALGCVKTLEVTIPSEGIAHPHLHCLLMVPDSYFDNIYPPQYWITAWRKAAKLNYDPSVRIKAIYQGQEMTILPELFKYGVKPMDLDNISLSDLHHLSRQLKNLRSLNKSGLFRTFFSSIEEDSLDLLGNNHNEDTLEVTGYRMSLQFLPGQQAYQVDHWEADTLCNREILDLQDYHRETLAK